MKKILIVNGLVYRNGTRSLKELDILCEDGKIKALGERGSIAVDGAELFDASGYKIYPGLVDVHTHGRVGYDFISADKSALGEVAVSYAQHGITTVMPALASAPFEEMLAQAELIDKYEPDEDEAAFCGVHFEGRYLNPKRKGAHASELLAPLAPEELENDILKSLKAFHITAAFELDKNGEFAKKARKIGATLAWGHTDAEYDLAATKSAEWEITAYTHLYNAMPPIHHRAGGAAVACLDGDGIAELICDGIHVSREMIRLTYRAKGVGGISLISDSMEATDAPDGEYTIAGNPVTVKGGQARLADGTLAGSTLSLERAVEIFRLCCGISLEEAIISATEVPAREVGVFDTCGSIDSGKRADMLLVPRDSGGLDIEKIILRGNFIK